MTSIRATSICIVAILPFLSGDKPLSPIDARKKVGETITVEMEVRAAKDRLENRGEIYLDAKPNFRDEKNFAVVITKAGAAKLKEAGTTTRRRTSWKRSSARREK